MREHSSYLAWHRSAYVMLLASSAFASPVSAAKFAFDERRTEVRFVYTMAYSTQRGRFTRVSGTLDFDDKAPEKSSINASIATASLTTGEPIVDNELKGASFFNAATSPAIKFKSRSVTPSGPEKADVAGDITVNGITKPVTLAVTLEPHDDAALKYDTGSKVFVAKTRISRSAFNMTDYQSMVADEVDIEIQAIVRPQK